MVLFIKQPITCWCLIICSQDFSTTEHKLWFFIKFVISCFLNHSSLSLFYSFWWCCLSSPLLTWFADTGCPLCPSFMAVRMDHQDFTFLGPLQFVKYSCVPQTLATCFETSLLKAYSPPAKVLCLAHKHHSEFTTSLSKSILCDNLLNFRFF